MCNEPLQRLVDLAVGNALTEFGGIHLTADELAVTVVDLREPSHPVSASHRGHLPIYPASVIKLFYLVAVHQWLEDRRLADTAELRRAMHDTIVHSSNDATSYLVDLLTGTTSGPELPPHELQMWHHQRNAVNRYFTLLGYENINVNKKPWSEGPYGREQQAVIAFEPKRNWLTTDTTARIMTEIATGRAVTAERSRQMMELLKRDFFPAGDAAPTSTDPADQARDFTAAGLPADAQLWSKAGWTSTHRHDASYIELATGAKFVLVTFTANHASEKGIIPSVAGTVVEQISRLR